MDIMKSYKIIKDLPNNKLQDYFLSNIVESLPFIYSLYERGATTTCERCFSKLGIIKNKLRNRLETPTLDKLLRVSLLNQKEINNFDFKKSYSHQDD